MTHYPVWTARITPWLRVGPTPGSFRIKAPPRTLQRQGRGPQFWAPYVTIVQLSARSGFRPHHI
jgi:hypothetical protein